MVLLLTAVSTDLGAAQPNPESEPETAPVVVDGSQLFKVRGTSANPAEQRASMIAARIESLAADRSIAVENLRLVESPGFTRIIAGERLVMAIADSDAAIERTTRGVLSALYLEKVQTSVRKYRFDRTPRELATSGLHAGGATLLLAAILFLMIRLSRRVEQWIDNRYKAKIRGLRIQSLQLVQEEKFWSGIHTGLHIARNALAILFCLIYVQYVCSQFPWTRRLAQQGSVLLLDPLRAMFVAVLGAIPNLIFIAMLIIVLRYVLRLMRLFFSAIEHGTLTISGFERDWSIPTYKILRMLIVAFGAVVAYPHMPGAQSDAFKGVSIFLGIVFSLGSTSAVANIIAGYMMTYRRAFKVGDRIQVMDFTGDVTEIRLQVTHLKSLKNEEVIVPNSEILNSKVINYSRLAKEQGLILHTTVGIGYETPWRQVEAMLLQASERTPGLLRQPPPFVLQKELGDFCVTYEINVYCDRPLESQALYTALHRSILDLFNEYGVQIMTPAYEGDPEVPKVVPKEKWFEAPAKALSKSFES